MARPPGIPLADIPLLAINGKLTDAAMDMCGAKLACALHYKHTRALVPLNASIAVKYLPNTALLKGALDDKVFALLSRSDRLHRANVDLGPQFQYRYGISNNSTIGAYLCFFRRSFALLTLVLNDPKLAAEHREFRFFSPLKGLSAPSL